MRKSKTLNEDLNQRYWDYQKAQFPNELNYFERPFSYDGRPPVFIQNESWRNVIINPDADQKGVDSYKRANPGSKLKTAVTKKPSQLKKGSKAANRRKSFCARMSGMKKKNTSSKTANDPDSRINKSLRKWNC